MPENDPEGVGLDVLVPSASVWEAVGEAELKGERLADRVEVGAEGVANTPEAFAKFIVEQLDSTRRVVKELGLKFD